MGFGVIGFDLFGFDCFGMGLYLFVSRWLLICFVDLFYVDWLI